MGTFLGNPHFRKDHGGNLNAAYDQLEKPLDLINVELSIPFAIDDVD